MRQLVSKRFADGGNNPFAKATDLSAGFSDLINLSIGDTDFTTDERIIRAAMADALAGHTRYTNSQGDPELISEVQNYYKAQYGQNVAKEEIFVTASSCFGMELALTAMLDAGDEVVLFSPYFSPYKDQVELAGGVAVEVATYEEDGFAIRKEALLAAITPRTKALILNNPCNPTGAAYDMACYELIRQVAIEHDLYILADEIYTDYMFESPFVPLRSMEGLADRVVTLNSFSKNYIMTGWRIGYIIAQPALILAMKSINESMVYSAPAPSQRAAIAALRLRDEIGDKYTSAYRKRVFFAADRINAIDKLSVRKPQGTFYLFINIKATGLTSTEFCDKVLREAHVVMIPGSAFGGAGEGYVRIACTVSEELLEKAFDRIAALSF